MLLAKNLKSKENEAERCKQRSKGVIAGRRILVAWFCVLTSWLRLIGRSAGRRSCKANFGRAVDRRAHQNTRTQSERQSDINNAITNTTVTPYRGTSGRPYWPESFRLTYISVLPAFHRSTHQHTSLCSHTCAQRTHHRVSQPLNPELSTGLDQILAWVPARFCSFR